MGPDSQASDRKTDQKRTAGSGIFESQDWESITTELVAFVLYVLKLYGYTSGRSGNLPGGTTATDIAATVIKKVLSGERSWDFRKYPNLATHLKLIARSEIDHLFQSWTSRKVSSFEPRDIESFPDSAGNPEQMYLEDERTEKMRFFTERIRNAMLDKPDLLPVLDQILAGRTKSGAIASRLGIEVTEIYRRKKRIRKLVLGLNLAVNELF